MDMLNLYRLNSLEEPTDEQLTALMAQVGEDARENSRRVQTELNRRMVALRRSVERKHAMAD